MTHPQQTVAEFGQQDDTAVEIRALWRQRLNVIMANLDNRERQHREIANAASHIGADYHGRFLIELLQNASDQVRRAGRSETVLTIVRTASHLAVLNDGMPFDARGVQSITSLAVSPKDAGESLGNKGVGFKATFQVSSRPEIFSARAGSVGLAAGAAWRIRLDQAPADVPSIASAFRQLIRRELDESGNRYPVLRAQYDGDIEKIVDFVLGEVRAAPPWKFPLPLEPTDLDARLAELSLSRSSLECAQTLIVLPLLPGAKTSEDVTKAMDELRAGSGEFILFLPGIARIEIFDRTRDLAICVRRSVGTAVERLPRGGQFRTLETSIGPVAAGAAPQAVRRWWEVARTLGGPEGIDEAEAAGERSAIREAVKDLPGEGWSRVEKATVRVALPRPREDLPAGMPLGADGILSIGLPTLDRTGTPFRIDAHFHGTISRTGINLKAQYNAILFEEAVKLVGGLLDRLKRDPDVGARRAVTLAFESTVGPLTSRFHEPRGLASGEVVLGVDGSRYVTASWLHLPATEDADMLNQLAPDTATAESHGFCSADPALLRRARDVLESLPGARPQVIGGDGRFLARLSDGISLLERAARQHRQDGPAFWEPFLNWALSRFPVSSLRDQKILPVATDDLASAEERIFIEPVERSPETPVAEEDEVELAAMPDDVRLALRFVDRNAVAMRATAGRELSMLGKRLSPSVGERLVLSPRLEQLFNDVLVHRLRAATDKDDTRALAMSLLRQGLSWVLQARDKTRTRVDTHRLLVPAARPGEPWRWVSPATVYFGPGWLDPECDALLNRAYGDLPLARVVPWSELEAHSGSFPREWWVRGMQAVGVASTARTLTLTLSSAPLQARSYDELTVSYHTFFTPGFSSSWLSWVRYLNDHRKRPNVVTSGQKYEVDRLSWIDGLERDSSRSAVFDMILRRPEHYASTVETQIRRDNGGDESTVEALWVHAIRTAGWALVPYERGFDESEGRGPPTRCWWLDPERRRRESLRLLPVVPERFDAASHLLHRFGVRRLEEAPPERLIETLQELAAAKGALAGKQRAAIALATEIYDLLQSACTKRPVDLSPLLQKPIPLMHDRTLVSVTLGELSVLYVDDDSVRAQYVAGFAAGHRLTSLRDGSKHLVAALRKVLGHGRVVLTSEAPIATGFSASPSSPTERLVDCLDRELKQTPVVIDLALLFAYGGRNPVDLDKQEFTEFWDRVQRARIQRGHFAPSAGGSDLRAFYDRDVLHVAESLQSYEIVEASWPLAGRASRDLWAAYALAISTGSFERFVAERGIGVAERVAVEARLNRGPVSRYAHVRAAIYAIWHARTGEAELERFEAGLKQSCHTAEALSAWLGVPTCPADLLRAAALNDEEAGSLQLIGTAALTVDDWQDARTRIGLLRWRFAESVRCFHDTRDDIIATMKSEAVHLQGVDLNAARTALEALATAAPPAHLFERVLERTEALELLLKDLSVLLRRPDVATKVPTLADRVAQALKAAPEQRFDRLRVDGTAREAAVYKSDAEPLRTQHAQSVLHNVLAVATAVAALEGESLDPRSVEEDPRVSALILGWWANRYGVLTVLQRALTAMTPKTTQALSVERAFHDPCPASELWARFPKLGPYSPANVAPTPRRIHLLGQDMDERGLDADLAHGSQGSIGKNLASLVDLQLDPRTLANTVRRQVQPDRIGGGRGNPGGRSGSGAASRATRELNGLIGEAFVYEQLRRTLPAFDEYAWRSENKTLYGLGPGDDSLGYDFYYVDDNGILTGRTERPSCLIEVKATAGSGDERFPITVNEWDKAMRCHHNLDSGLYLIIRVERVRDAPRIADVILDPFGLWRQGQLAVDAKDLWAHVAPATP